MKRTKKFRAFLLGAAAAVLVSATALVAYAYDGSSDPLITLSYLLQFRQNTIDPEIASLQSEIDALQTQITALQSRLDSFAYTSTNSDSQAEYEIIYVTEGARVLATSSCDMMLRSGSAVAISPSVEQGLSDYTDGVEIMNDEAIAINHMLLIPRGDGRGVYITSAEAYIMVRGEYTIES